MKRMQLGKRTMALLTALFILLGTLPFSMGHVHAEEPTDYPTIALDTEETVMLDGVDAMEKVFAFTPDESGFYAFKSLHNTADPVGRILDAEGNELVRSDDSVDSYEFAAVYSMEAGTTYLLEVTLHDQYQSASVTVKVARAKFPTEVSLDVGDTYTNSVFSRTKLDYAISPADADCAQHFQSSDPETVLVDEAGNIFLKKPGSATVTVTAAPGVTDSVVITVLDAIDITLDTAYGAANERGLSSTFRFTPEETAFYCFFSDLENDTCMLEIYRAGGEYVDSTTVYGERLSRIDSLEAGETYYYRFESFSYGVSRSIQLAKTVDPTAISLNYTEIDGTVGTTAQLVATASPVNSLLPALTWSSADESVATVDENGRITLLSQGSTTVTASSEEFEVSCAVRVNDVPVLSREKIADAHIYAPEESAIFTFTPELDGYYAFWSISNSDTYGVLCDAEGQILAETDDGIEGANFLIPYHLTAGTTYTLKARYWQNNEEGSFAVTVALVDEEYNVIHEVLDYSTHTDADHSGLCIHCEQLLTEKHVYNDQYVCFCGYLHTHQSTGWTPNGDLHTSECLCGFLMEEDHDFSAGNCICGEEKPCEHAISNWAYDEAAHWGTCELCTSYVEKNHEYGDDGTCICGYFEHEHAVAVWENCDEEKHWGWCELCGIYMEEAHTLEADGRCVCGYFVHEHTVAVWGSYSEERHWAECDLCDEYMEEEHSFDADGRCVCGYFVHEHTVVAWAIYNEERHWDRCELCDIYMEEEHSFDADGRCACGYFVHEHEVSDWINDYDEEEHIGSCALCSVTVYASHEYGTDGRCACGYYIHDHELSTWELDMETHTRICACGYRFSVEEHVFDADGQCVCGYEQHDHKISRWGYAEDYHYGLCDICGLDYQVAHAFDADGQCVCGYFEHKHTCEEWGFGANTHGGECEICFLEVMLDHELVDGKCACGYEEHEHTVSDWRKAFDAHYGYCDLCGLYQEEAHLFDESKVCACGYEEHVHHYDDYLFDELCHWYVCSACEVIKDTSGNHSYGEDGRCRCGRVMLVGVRIGDRCLQDGDYLDQNGHITKSAPADGGYAYYRDGVLTLKDFTLVYDKDPDDTMYGSTGIYSEQDLEMVLVGNNRICALNGDGIGIPLHSLLISGEGSLHVEGFGDYDGIEVGEDLTVEGGTLTIIATDNGIECYDELYLHGGFIFIDAGDDGINCEEGVNIEEGVTLVIRAEDHGIDNHGNGVMINGGFVYINTRDEHGIVTYDDVIIGGGTVIIDVDGDHGIVAEGSVNISGGRLSVNTKAPRTYAIVSGGALLLPSEMSGYHPLPTREGEYALALNDEALASFALDIEDSESALLERDWITLKTDVIYTGEPHTPVLTVTDPKTGALLKEGTDYRVNMPAAPFTKPGAYQVTVIGMGNYSGVIGETVWVYERFELLPGQSGKQPFFHHESLKNGHFAPKADGTYTVTVTPDGDASFCVYDADGNEIATVTQNEEGETLSWTKEMKAGEEYFFNFFTYGFFDVTVGLSAECNEHLGGTASETSLAVCDRCGAEYGNLLPPGSSEELGSEEATESGSESGSSGENETPAKKSGLSGGTVAIIAVGGSAAVLLLGFSLFWFVIKKKTFADLFAVFKR